MIRNIQAYPGTFSGHFPHRIATTELVCASRNLCFPGECGKESLYSKSLKLCTSPVGLGVGCVSDSCRLGCMALYWKANVQAYVGSSCGWNPSLLRYLDALSGNGVIQFFLKRKSLYCSVVLLPLWGGGLLLGKGPFLCIFQCGVSCVLSIPKTIRNSNSLYVQLSLRIKASRKVIWSVMFFNFHCLAKCLIAIPLQLVTMSCFDNTVSQLSVKDFLIA